ncbi:MAG: type II secretion system F family protein [Tissierellia bacterium]|nr:type II secretion system F family protein [Tissierellia bacterium]
MIYRYMIKTSHGWRGGLVQATSWEKARQVKPHAYLIRPLFQRKEEPEAFLWAIGILTEQGCTLYEALSLLAQSKEFRRDHKKILAMRRSMEQGKTFSEGMREHMNLSPFILGYVELAESTGKISHSLETIETYLERRKEVRRKVRDGLSYPLVLLCMSILMLFVLSSLVFPVFKDLFASYGASLPLLTRLTMAFAKGVSSYGIYLLFAILLSYGIFQWCKIYYPRLDVWMERRKYEGWKGFLYREAFYEDFFRKLSMVYGYHKNIVESLDILVRTEENVYIKEKLQQFLPAMEEGATFRATASNSGLFSENILALLGSVRTSGVTTEVARSISQYYEKRYQYKLQRFLGWLGPITVTVAGLCIGTMALSLLLPLFSMPSIF